jgi:hypothetical protein
VTGFAAQVVTHRLLPGEGDRPKLTTLPPSSANSGGQLLFRDRLHQGDRFDGQNGNHGRDKNVTTLHADLPIP